MLSSRVSLLPNVLSSIARDLGEQKKKKKKRRKKKKKKKKIRLYPLYVDKILNTATSR